MSISHQPTVLVTHPIFEQTRSVLAPHVQLIVNEQPSPWSREELKQRAADVDGLLAFMTDCIDQDFLAGCRRLRVIGAALKGYDNIDIDACRAAGVTVTIVPDLLTVPTAELAIGLMLALGRNMLVGDRQIRASGFSGWRPSLYGMGLQDATVGILGYGLVGRAIAARLQSFGCNLLASDQRKPPARELAHDRVVWVNQRSLLRQSDYVVLALPLTPKTIHVIDHDAIEGMKPGARLINPARGSLVNEAAVADALDRGHLAGYAADVFECEDWARQPRPDRIEPRLRSAEASTVLTPHIGSAVMDVRRQIELSAATGIIDVLQGRKPSHALEIAAQPPEANHKNDQSIAHQNLSGSC